MVNAARTMLLNLDGSGAPTTPFGEWSDPAYRATALPPDLAAIESALYNGTTDQGLRDYFAALYTAVLHAGDYADHVAGYGAACTYWPPAAPPVVVPPSPYRIVAAAVSGDVASGAGTIVPAPAPWVTDDWVVPGLTTPGLVAPGLQEAPPPSPVAVPVSAAAPAPLTVLNTAAPVAGLATLMQSWTVTRTTADAVTVQRVGADAVGSPPLTWDANQESATFPLAGSTLVAMMPATAAAGTTWSVDAVLRPAEGIAEIVARLGALPPTAFATLFGLAPQPEPYATYYQLWASQDQAPDRLTGVLLALIRRIYEILTGTV